MSAFESSHQEPNRKKLIAIFGVDGSGKSTVIDAVTADLRGSIKALQGLRPRNYTNSTGLIWNHAFPPRGRLLSSFKLLLRALEWWWVYHIRYATLLAKGHVIFCDRFYFHDILVDPLKYRYGGPKWLVNIMLAALPVPDLYILLDAPESALAFRKQEATLDEIKRLRFAYVDLVHKQACGYVVDASEPLAAVVENVLGIIQQHIKDAPEFIQGERVE